MCRQQHSSAHLAMYRKHVDRFIMDLSMSTEHHTWYRRPSRRDESYVVLCLRYHALVCHHMSCQAALYRGIPHCASRSGHHARPRAPCHARGAAREAETRAPQRGEPARVRGRAGGGSLLLYRNFVSHSMQHHAWPE